MAYLLLLLSLSAGATAATPCRADLDCQISQDDSWRCQHDASASGPMANCHLPGPGTAGNSTCSCANPTCSKGAATPRNASAQVQYLMIGDSISLGMQGQVKSMLAQHGWSLEHNPGNAASSNNGNHCVGDWVQPMSRKWDVISFNFGLHDLGYDTERITVSQYTALLTNITNFLVSMQRMHSTKLLWVTTTPVPSCPVYSVDGPCNHTNGCLNPPRFESDVFLYNEAAAGIIANANKNGANISTLDLFSFVISKCGGDKNYVNCTGFQLPENVHYEPAGWTALAEKTSDALLQLF
eukprot:m.54127 g.54127  ORF g.54127 m.54127 type:complete len:296 (-) comp10903_c0_seq1:3253-4140(-)